jgi:hypothetical protein
MLPPHILLKIPKHTQLPNTTKLNNIQYKNTFRFQYGFITRVIIRNYIFSYYHSSNQRVAQPRYGLIDTDIIRGLCRGLPPYPWPTRIVSRAFSANGFYEYRHLHFVFFLTHLPQDCLTALWTDRHDTIRGLCRGLPSYPWPTRIVSVAFHKFLIRLGFCLDDR